MHELDILVGQIQRKQEYESMGMVQALKPWHKKRPKIKLIRHMKKKKENM